MAEHIKSPSDDGDSPGNAGMVLSTPVVIVWNSRQENKWNSKLPVVINEFSKK